MSKDIYKFLKAEHIHTLNGKSLTGTSSIGNVLAKGGLVYWASGKACEKFGWLNPKKFTEDIRILQANTTRDEIDKLTTKEYLALLDTAYKSHATSLKDSAVTGIDRHAVLDRFVKIEMKRENIEPLTKEETELIQMFMDWSRINVKKFLWSEAHCYSKELWIGGISDNGAELKNGTYAVIDYKSGKEAYITNFIQACLYAIQINENGLFSENGEHSKKLDKPIEKIVIIPFGAEKMPPNKDIIRNVSDFTRGSECAVELYRLIGLDERIKQ